MKIDRIRMDIDKKLAGVIPSVQWDNNTRFLHINIRNGAKALDLTGYSVKVAGLKPDGTSFLNDVKIINAKEGFIEVVLTEQMNAAAGSVKCDIKIYNAQGVLTTQPFIIDVEPSVASKAIMSSNEFKTLSEALTLVGNIDNKFEALTAEAVAQATEQEIRKQVSQGTMANLAIADNSIEGKKLKNASITKEKLHPDFTLKLSQLGEDIITPVSSGMGRVNVFDKTKGEDGFVNSTTGVVNNAPAGRNWTSEFIPCIPGETLRKCDNSSNNVNAQNICFYGQDYLFIKGVPLHPIDNWKTIVVPEGAYFFRFDMLQTYRNTEEIYADRTDTTEIQIFDRTKGSKGWVSTIDGSIRNSDKDWTSDFIPCIPGEILRKCDNSSNSVNTQDHCFYDRNKRFLKGIQLGSGQDWKTIVVPEGAYFFRFDMLQTYRNTEEIYASRVKGEPIFYSYLNEEIRVKGANIQDFSIDMDDLEGSLIEKNLSYDAKENVFDRTKGSKGWVSTIDGSIRNSDKDWTSDFIPYIPGETLIKCDNSSNAVNTQDICFYNEEKVFVSGIKLAPTENWKEIITPKNACFFRFDMLQAYRATEEIYANRSKEINVFDKNKGNGGYLGHEHGMIINFGSTKDWTSEFIPCIPGETLRKCDNSSNNVNAQNICFYDRYKRFVEGKNLLTIDNWKTIVVPKNAYFFRFDMLQTHKDTEEIYAQRGTAVYYNVLSENIKIAKENIIGFDADDGPEDDESIVIGDTGDKYKIGVDCRGNVYSKFVNTEIPTVELDGDMEGISKDTKVTMSIKYRSKTKNFDGKCTMAWQGNGSVNYPKKNYKIKLMTTEGKKMNVGFRNWVPQDSYHLKANFTDSSHMRNIFMANLMYDVRKEDLPTKGRSTIDGFPIRVKINGQDQGIYTWNLKQSKETYGLTKENPNHLMYRCEQHHGAGSFASISNIKTAWEDKFPETEDSLLASTNRAKLSRMISWVATADDATFKKDISKYLNLNYLIDYWIYSVCFMAGDNLGRNMNIITYDGEVWYVTLYDLDTCAGIQYNGNTLPYDFKIPSQAECKTSVLFSKLIKNFKGEIINRYLELRNTAFATESLLTNIKEYMDFIGSENYQLDKQLWPTIKSEAISYNYIKNNITKRLDMIDADLTILTEGR